MVRRGIFPPAAGCVPRARPPCAGAGRAGAALGERRGTARDLPACGRGLSAGRAAVRGAGRAGLAACTRRGAGGCGVRRAARHGPRPPPLRLGPGRRRTTCRWTLGAAVRQPAVAGARRVLGAPAAAAPAAPGLTGALRPGRRLRRGVEPRCPSSAQTAGATSDKTKETARRQETVRDITNLLRQAGGTECSRDRARIGARHYTGENWPRPRGMSPAGAGRCPLQAPGKPSAVSPRSRFGSQ